MSPTTLKTAIKNAYSTVNDKAIGGDITMETLRDDIADELAKAIHKHVKDVLSGMLGAGAPIAQDGGTGLKTTMKTFVDGL